jgi:hypothetical protein
LLRLWAWQEHAVVERVQEAVFVNPAFLIHQDAMHNRDLPGGPTEAE